MSDINQLYHEVIVDHGRHPRNFGRLEEGAIHLVGRNPVCGDTLTLYLQIKNKVVVDAKFEGQGCAISVASTSLMIQAIKGKTVEEAKALFHAFHALITEKNADEAAKILLGKLMILAGVAEYPSRVKCATLGWQTLMALLTGKQDVVSTEAS